MSAAAAAIRAIVREPPDADRGPGGPIPFVAFVPFGVPFWRTAIGLSPLPSAFYVARGVSILPESVVPRKMRRLVARVSNV